MSSSLPLILASQSPRRRELLAEAGYAFEVMPPGESAESGGDAGECLARELVTRLAWRKAADVARRVDCGIVIGCDTVAEVEGRILGKPADRRHAREMLELLRGKLHRVHSGLCLWQRPGDQVRVESDVTTLAMASISDGELELYLDSEAWRGKAGAFGYQDRHGWLTIVSGSESNVVGLPLELLARMLREVQAGSGGGSVE
jgi:septum formation protein